MTRKKSHERSLQDIADDATAEVPPEVAFAAFVYEDRTEFTHTTNGEASVEAVFNGLSTHAAALSQITGLSVPQILDAIREVAAEKGDEGPDPRGGR